MTRSPPASPSAGFRPRALLDRFNIEVISTTDAATSDLQHHAKLAADGLGERVFPTFRPDAVAYLDRPTWRADIAELAKISGDRHHDVRRLSGCTAFPPRRASSKLAPAPPTTATYSPIRLRWRQRAAGELYARVLDGAEPSQAEVDAFAANMLYQMAEMSCEDGLVMQIHPGVLRDHNSAICHNVRIRTRATTSPFRPSSPGRCGRCWTGSAPIPGFGSSSSPSTRRLSAGSWPRSPAPTPRSGWVPHGGSSTHPRACAGSGRSPSRRPASTTPRASSTTHGPTRPYPLAMIYPVASTPATSRGWSWSIGSAWTRPSRRPIDLAYNLPKESYARPGP